MREKVKEISQRPKLPKGIIDMINEHEKFCQEFYVGKGDVIVGLKIMDRQEADIIKAYNNFAMREGQNARN